jgi:bifunctional DNase/RNase
MYLLCDCRIRLERVTTAQNGHNGILVFVRHESRSAWIMGVERGIVIHVSGDSLFCLCKLLRNEPTNRPMPLDLLIGVLRHAGEHSSDEWGIVRVAVTAMRDDTYIARVFFGNQRTGEVTLEQDIRPSDATYLAHFWRAPIYVDAKVWESTAITHAELRASAPEYSFRTNRRPIVDVTDDHADEPVAEDRVASQGATPSRRRTIDHAGLLCASHLRHFSELTLSTWQVLHQYLFVLLNLCPCSCKIVHFSGLCRASDKISAWCMCRETRLRKHYLVTIWKI